MVFNICLVLLSIFMITSSWGSESEESPSLPTEEEEVHPSDAVAQPDRDDHNRRYPSGQTGPIYPQQHGGGLLGGIIPSILGSIGGVNTGFGGSGYRPGPIGGVNAGFGGSGYRPGPIGGFVPGIGGSSYRPYPPQISQQYFNCYNRYPGYYADMQNDCRGYFYCSHDGGQYYYECDYGLVFNQYEQTCDRRGQHECRESHRYYRK